MKKFLWELKSQPLISSIAVIGTALSVFLIMVVVMLHNVQVLPFHPESNRDRLMHGENIHLSGIGENEGSQMSMPGSLAYMKELYTDMPGIDEISFYVHASSRNDLMLPGERPYTVDVKMVDDAYFRIFDFKVLSGKPFEHAAFESGLHELVITENVARTIFGATDVAGREILLGGNPYKVAAVVADVPQFATNTYSQAYIPYTVSPDKMEQTWGNDKIRMGGPFATYLLRSKGVSAKEVKEETARRIEAISSRLRADNYEIIYHNQPYIQEEVIISHGSNTTPDLSWERKTRYSTYLILLLIPAINLSVISQSRLRRRMSEIGVRRAFGCTRGRVIVDILAENFAVTLMGGLIGFILSVVYAWIYSVSTLPSFGISSSASGISAEMLINWSSFFFALLFCFILNVLSIGIPAWRASRVSPVEALSNHKI